MRYANLFDRKIFTSKQWINMEITVVNDKKNWYQKIIIGGDLIINIWYDVDESIKQSIISQCLQLYDYIKIATYYVHR